MSIDTIRTHAENLKALGWFMKHVEQAPPRPIARMMAFAVNAAAENVARAVDYWPARPAREQVPEENDKLQSIRHDALMAAEQARDLYGFEERPGCLEDLQAHGEAIWAFGDMVLDTLADWESMDWGRPVNQGGALRWAMGGGALNG